MFISVGSVRASTLGAGDNEGDGISLCAMSKEDAGLARR